MAPTSKSVTAVKKLELSKLDPNQIQREMMGKDLDLGKLVVYLKSAILFDTTDRVIDVNVNRGIDGASTVDVTLNDYDRAILRSWALNAKLDINIDGLWFRLVSCSKNAGDDELVLTFEQREIALLRSYPKPDTTNYTIENAKKWVKWASRDKVTRAEFILNLIREVKEVDIPVVIPHLQQTQPIAKTTDVSTQYSTPDAVASASGIPTDYNANKTTQPSVGAGKKATDKTVTVTRTKALMAKTARANKSQIANANTILTVGQKMGARRKVLVAAIMTAITESVLQNLSGGDGTSVGLFQQIDTGWGSYDDRHDPATAAKMFFEHCIKYDKDNPDVSFNDLCQGVQGSGHPDAYGQWRWEAEAYCNAFGIPPGGEGNAVSGGTAGGADSTTEGSAADANAMGQTWTNPGTDGSYYYYRGIPPTRNKGWWKREDNWTCIKRLADEVGWRAFFIGGVFYFMTDDDLFKTQPIATVNEETPGVMGIGFDYDVGRQGATVDLPCQVGLWLAPPGSLIVLEDMGPLDGRWLVNTFTRSLFSDNADIQLTKPQPKLPEPATESTQLPTWAGVAAKPAAAGAPSTNQAEFGGIPGMNDGSRNAIVAVALKAWNIQNGTGGEKKWPYYYEEHRPYPKSLWDADCHNAVHGIDCSSFATLVYKEAGLPDPNGPKYNYNGQGYTGTLVQQGMPVNVPQPGDLVFYFGSAIVPGHVTVYIGNGEVIHCPSPPGPQPGVVRAKMWDGAVAMRSYVSAQTASPPAPKANLPSTAGSQPGSTWDVMIQAGHTIPAGRTDEPYGHSGETGAAGEQAFSAAVRDASMTSFNNDDRFNARAGTAWDASAGLNATQDDDINYMGDVFVSVHYSVGTPGSGFFLGYTRGATDGRSGTLASGSSNLADKIAARFSAIAGAPSRQPDNQGFGNPSGDPSGASGWGYYAWGSTQRQAPNNVDHVPNARAAVIIECGLDSDSTWLGNNQSNIGRALYLGICDYFGLAPK